VEQATKQPTTAQKASKQGTSNKATAPKKVKKTNMLGYKKKQTTERTILSLLTNQPRQLTNFSKFL
jgi:hypothetical protein